MTVYQAALSRDLTEMAARAIAAYSALSASQKLRHRYMQRRSFAKWAGREMPHEAGLSDAQVGLLLIGERLT